jgi:hypothetical protein
MDKKRQKKNKLSAALLENKRLDWIHSVMDNDKY